MINRNLKYWQEKAWLMVEDYTPELQQLIPKRKIKKLTDQIGALAEKYYRNVLETMQVDIQTEMMAREFTEQAMQEMLNQKLQEIQQG